MPKFNLNKLLAFKLMSQNFGQLKIVLAKMLEAISIRKALVSDLEKIYRFDVFGGDRKAEIEREECYVATRDQIIAGYVTFDHTFYGRPFIRFLCVCPEFQRTGVGDKIMQFIERKCEGERVFASTESNNLPMIKLFEKREYKISGLGSSPP